MARIGGARLVNIYTKKIAIAKNLCFKQEIFGYKQIS